MSTRTYALYLTHGLVYVIVARYLPMDSPITIAAMLLASTIVADAVYRFVERPIMELRNPDNQRPLMELSGALTRLQTRFAFELDLLMGRDMTPAYAPALVERRKTCRI